MIAVLGAAEDARGFALAGVPAIRCRTGGDVARALAACRADALVIVSPPIAALAADEIERVRHQSGGPMIVALPDTPEAA